MVDTGYRASYLAAMSGRRLVMLGTLFTLFSGILLCRLWMVQVHSGEEHVAAVARQSIRRLRVTPVRGRIFATDGQVLVDNKANFNLVFHVSEMRRPGARRHTEEHILGLAAGLAAELGRENPLTPAQVRRHLEVYPALPLIVFTNLSSRDLAILAEMIPPVPSVEVQAGFTRFYPHPRRATHVLGFAGHIRPKDEEKEYSYAMPELQGRAGLEQVYDEQLSGQPGSKMVRVNTLGYVYEQIGESAPPRNGNDLILTLDLRAQETAERLMAPHHGALVLLEARTGAVLAMASSPSYNLAELDAATYGRLAADEEGKPLINRALAAGYLPGSIVKPLIGLAALEAGIATVQGPVVDCQGAYRIGNARIRCWLRSGHGKLDLPHAIEQSCNTYFIQLGQEIGLDALTPFLRGAGLGEAPAIDLPYPGTGLVPSRDWARRYWGRNWIAIDTAFLSIGQGAINISALQAAVYCAALANGGTVYRPYLLKSLRTSKGSVIQTTPPRAMRRLPVAKENLELVRQGMDLVVNGENATATGARNPAISVAGKTGTAEVKSAEDEHKNTWFIGYAPVDAPRYAIAIVIERGASGGRTAAPLAGRLFAEWLAAADGTTAP